MARINRFSRNRQIRGRDLDSLIDKVNALSHIRGSGGINIVTGPLGTSIIGTGIGKGIPVRRARTTQSAPSKTYITANLYDISGNEQTSGGESGINVHCSIMGNVNLNVAVPRLENNEDVFVAKLPYDSASTIVNRWYCVSLFQKSQDCE